MSGELMFTDVKRQMYCILIGSVHLGLRCFISQLSVLLYTYNVCTPMPTYMPLCMVCVCESSDDGKAHYKHSTSVAFAFLIIESKILKAPFWLLQEVKPCLTWAGIFLWHFQSLVFSLRRHVLVQAINTCLGACITPIEEPRGGLRERVPVEMEPQVPKGELEEMKNFNQEYFYTKT